jgi:membrane protease YdiL (CAAX protease family)
MRATAPAWQTRGLAALSVAAWAAGFYVVGRAGTWAPLAVLGPALAALSLALQPGGRALLVPDRRLVALGLAGAALMTGATYLLFHLLSALWPPLRELTAGLYAILAAPRFTPLERGVLVPLVAGAEEILFRGVVLPAAAAPVPAGSARPLLLLPSGRDLVHVAGVGALVALAHLPSGSLLLALVAFLCGTAWGLLRTSTGSLVPGLITHVVWDLAILIGWPLV